jgi:hypothetical protein
MRAKILFFLSLFVKLVYSQDAKTIKEINELIGPKFKFKNDTSFYDDKFFVLEKKNNQRLFIIKAHCESNNDNFVNDEKIFVFTKSNNKLIIVDSSTEFGRDGRGVKINFSKDTIILENSYHGGEYKLFYVFNSDSKKYFLRLIKNWTSSKNDGHYTKWYYAYNVMTQKLSVLKEDGQLLIDSWKKSKTEQKIINVALPKNFKKELSNFIDPIWGDTDVYDKIFNNENK